MSLKQLAQSWIYDHKLWVLPLLAFFVTWLLSWFGLAGVFGASSARVILITTSSGLIAWLVYLLVLLRQNKQASQLEILRLSNLTEQANARMAGVFQLSSVYAHAASENEVIETLLKLCLELTGAQGASFVPLDDRGQPMAALARGEFPFPALNAWIEYLATPAVRQRCQQCQNMAQLNTSCPLLKGPFADVNGLFCLPVSTGNREWGVMNLYMPDLKQMDADTEAFLKTLLQETALALESTRLRQREFEALRQIRALQQKADLSGVLAALLENIQSAFEADLAQIEIQTDRGQRQVTIGMPPPGSNALVSQTIDSILRTGEAVQVRETPPDTRISEGGYILLAVPLLSMQKQVMGALVVVTKHSAKPDMHHLCLLHAFAAQVELVVENANLLAEIEYRTVIQERTRLAREIHDGLAQTLGFLKLQAAQSMNYLNKSDVERVRTTLSMVYNTISEAYQDVRAAIDGLRMDTGHQGNLAWIDPTLLEFEDLAGVSAHFEMDSRPEAVPAEIETQLIRIVQEALNNIRKHAQAKNVWLRSAVKSGDWWLEIQDDGTGFMPEDIPTTSRYGLHGMRERAELIGADFQVVSKPNQGTLIRLRVPANLLLNWSTLHLRGVSS